MPGLDPQFPGGAQRLADDFCVKPSVVDAGDEHMVASPATPGPFAFQTQRKNEPGHRAKWDVRVK